MNIGFDAKRAYHNSTGLGHYSRTLIRLLASHYPEHEYYLYNPKPSSVFNLEEKNIHERRPSSPIDRFFSSAWRSSWVKKDLKRDGINLYHGLSHEIPVGIQRTGIKSVVTMHDLIHERYPNQYSAVDVKIYSKKFRYACANADHIVAISNQTRDDLLQYYVVPAEKITVCYQSCSPAFAKRIDEAEKFRIAAKYGLPPKFFLYVGSIIERKNLMNVCKAMYILRNEIEIPLVVVGDGGKYKQKVRDFLLQHHLENKVIFLADGKSSKDPGYVTGRDLPAIYQSAVCLIYPSFFEGFGIPVLEALWSRLPVITSNVSCLPEAGGDAAFYANPDSAEQIADGMKQIYTNEDLSKKMVEKGLLHAQKFAPEKYASNMIDIYKKIW